MSAFLNLASFKPVALKHAFRDTTFNDILTVVSGQVGIGTTLPTEMLTLSGNMALDNGAVIVAKNSSGVAEQCFWPRYTDNGTYLKYGAGGLKVKNNSGTDVVTVDVSGNMVASGSVTTSTSVLAPLGVVGAPSYSFTGDTNTGMWSPAAETVAMSTAGVERMRVLSAGNVGIGITTPLTKLHVVGTGTQTLGSYFYLLQGGTGSGTAGTFSDVSIIASSVIHAVAFKAYSDRRIKKEITDIEDGASLDIVRALKPKNYHYIDQVARTSSNVYGFIAQEVKEVLPYSVVTATDYIPSIYSAGVVKSDDLVELSTAHDLVIGDKIKLYSASNEHITCVTSVPSSNVFQVKDSLPDINDVFVFGKEVADFHVLDKMSMIPIIVAAMQELDRQLNTERTEHEQTKSRLAMIEARLSAANIL